MPNFRNPFRDDGPARPRGAIPVFDPFLEQEQVAQFIHNFEIPVRANGKRGEELFDLILSGIKEVFDVDAVIASGAVRDLVAGCPNETKDVDVFIPMKPEDFIEKGPELGWSGGIKLTHNEKYGKLSRRALGIMQGMQIDLVFQDKPLDAEGVATFPVFAQRGVYILGEGRGLSPEAQSDIENKRFTIDPTITDKKKLKDVLAKVNGWKKRPFYAGWKIVEPDIKEWWEVKEEEKVKDTGLNCNTYTMSTGSVFGKVLMDNGFDRWWVEGDANA